MAGHGGPEPEAESRRSATGTRALSEMGFSVLLVGVLVAIAGVAGLVYLGPVEGPLSSDSNGSNDVELNTTQVSVQVIEAVNRERVDHGLEPVTIDPELQEVTLEHSQDMASRDYYGHETPDGLTPLDRVRASEAECESVGENIAATWWQTEFRTNGGETDRHTSIDSLATGLVDQWRNSPEHRENMLESRWERTGVGVVLTADQEVIVTQKFCR